MSDCPSSIAEMSKSKNIVIIQGKNTHGSKPQNWPSTNATRVPHMGSDEFKYGFPSNGLAVLSNKWWESSGEDTNDNVNIDDGKQSKDTELKSEVAVDHADDVDGKGVEAKNSESAIDFRGTGLLTHLRKRAAKEGNEALRLGVYRGFDVSTGGVKERKLLRRIFKSALSSNQKMTGPSDS